MGCHMNSKLKCQYNAHSGKTCFNYTGTGNSNVRIKTHRSSVVEQHIESHRLVVQQ